MGKGGKVMKEPSTFKKVISGAKFAIAFLVIGLVAFAVGVFVRVTERNSLLPVSATVSEIAYNDFDEPKDIVVTYEVNGKTYESKLGYFSSSYKVGHTITLFYDPNDPSSVQTDERGFRDQAFLLGGVFFVLGAAGVLSSLRKVRRLEDEKKLSSLSFEEILLSENRPQREKAEPFYFQTDRKLFYQGYSLEDKFRHKMMDAKMLKHAIFSQCEFEFTDHDKKKSAKHLVGQTEVTSFDFGFFETVVRSTFSFDGKDVWKMLKELGVSVTIARTAADDVRFTVFYGAEKVALIRRTSVFVHEEDEVRHSHRKHFLAQGFYRLITREEDLDLLFLIMFTLARTELSFQQLRESKKVLSGEKK